MKAASNRDPVLAVYLRDVDRTLLSVRSTMKLAEFLLRLGGALGGQRHPADLLAPGSSFNGDASEEFAVATPQAANEMLAVVEDFGVSVAAEWLGLLLCGSLRFIRQPCRKKCSNGESGCGKG